MSHKVWMVNGLVINDYQDMVQDDATIVSILEGGLGHPRRRVNVSERLGRWPIISNVSRPAHRLSLYTQFVQSALDDRKAKARLLYTALNPERESAVKLWAANNVLPPDVLLVYGPWDIDKGETSWELTELLSEETAAVTGAMRFEDFTGRARALVVEEGTTNYCTNPRMYDGNSDNRADSFGRNSNLSGAPTESIISHPISERGWAQRIQYTGVAGDSNQVWFYKFSTASGEFSAGDDVTISFDYWGSADNGLDFYVEVFDSSNNIIADVSLPDLVPTESVQRASLTYESLPANTDYVRFRFDAVDSCSTGDEFDVRFGAVQIEKSAYATSYCAGSLSHCSWSGTEDASTSTRAATEVNLDEHSDLLSSNNNFSISLWWQAPLDYDADWPSNAILFDTRGGATERVSLYYRSAGPGTYDIYLIVLGSSSLGPDSGALTFSAGDWLHIVATVDYSSNSYKIYIDGELSGSGTTSASAPTLTAMNLGSDTSGANQAGGAYAGLRMFDRVLSSNEVAALYATGGEFCARYVEVLADAVQPAVIGGSEVPWDATVATLTVNGDVRWRHRDGDIAFWRIDDATASLVVDVDSDDEVYPIYRVTPKSAKSSGYIYKRWLPIVWKAEKAATNYPLRATLDTATLVTAGKMQSDGDDLRIESDGSEIDRWLDNMNAASTKIWFNLDFEAGVDLTLKTAIASSGDIDEIEFNESVDGLPSDGIILIDSEAFAYTSRSTSGQKVSGITRAAKGTSEAAHTADTTCYWIQHDVWIMYGDSSVNAPTVDDDYKPIFELDTSTNDSWVYEEFGSSGGLRPGTAAVLKISGGTVTQTTGNQGGSADPWTELGMYVKGGVSVENGVAYVYNPCGIAAANWTNGEYYIYSPSTGNFRTVKSASGNGWTTVTTKSFGTTGSWTAWSQNDTGITGAYYVGFRASSYQEAYFEAADLTVTLDSSYTPDVTVNSEQSNYELACTITNEETGESMTLEFSMGTDETLVVDTYKKSITYLADDSQQMQARSLDSARREWLRLVRGENELSFSDENTTEIEIDILWDRRDWQ